MAVTQLMLSVSLHSELAERCSLDVSRHLVPSNRRGLNTSLQCVRQAPTTWLYPTLFLIFFWTGSCSVAHSGLELAILLSQPPRCWDYRLHHQAQFLPSFTLSLSRDSVQSHEESLSVLRSSNEFMHYAVNVALQKVQQLIQRGHVSGPDGRNPDRIFQNLCDITR